MPGQPPLTVEDIFGARGALAVLLPHFEHRPPQEAFAAAAWKVFTEGENLLAEVGTGTGKTLGYLVPAAASGRRAVISTGTKTLQEQIHAQDVPLLQRLWPGWKAAYLKGRANYLCRLRLEEILAKPFLPGSREGDGLARIAAWATRTAQGDRAELPWLPDDDPLWGLVGAEQEACLWARCPRYQDCFVTRARRRAASADAVVVNHHLLLAEAAAGEAGSGFLPEADILVVDEAHLLEETAVHHIGLDVAGPQVARFFRDFNLAWGEEAGRKAGKSVRRGFELLDRLGASVPPADGSFGLPEEGPETAAPAALKSMGAHLAEMASLLAGLGEETLEVESLRRRAGRLVDAVNFIAERRESEFIYWYERRGEQVTFNASPVDVSADLPRLLFSRFRSVLLTSATLAVGGGFRYARGRLGIGEGAELIAGGPFDYERQAVLFVPPDMPHPNTPDYAEITADRIVPLLELTGGRAFVLCTSRRGMEIIRDRLKEKTSFRVLAQGESPRSTLLEEFRRGEGAVMVATTSFWQGVDVPGEALSAVIIDRLPFASPDDPLTAGRIERARERGGNPFHDFQLPAAVIMLKQGLGRLIRRATDRGLLAIMDSRILNKSYGRVFLASLPKMNLVHTEEELKKAYAALMK